MEEEEEPLEFVQPMMLCGMLQTSIARCDLVKVGESLIELAGGASGPETSDRLLADNARLDVE